MADLRIVDAPLLSTVKGTEKIPTGGEGNFSVSVNQVADFAKLKWFLATEEYVDNAVGNVQDDLNLHKNNESNPHNVTKTQVGLGNVDNTADLDKPIGSATQAALLTLAQTKADKTYVDVQLNNKADKATTYSKIETESLVSAKSDTTYVNTKYSSHIKTFLNTGTALSNTVNGEYFFVISNDSEKVEDLYLNVNGVATNQNKSELSSLLQHNSILGRDVTGAHQATSISTSSGVTQQQINDFGGAKWYAKVGGYELNARVMLETGDIVKSTMPYNTTDPNIDMTGWKFDDNTVESIADLLTIENPKHNQVAFVRHYDLEQGILDGGGIFVYQNTNQLTNDGGYIFNGWTRKLERPIFTPEMFGAKGDLSKDDAPNIRSCTNSARTNKIKCIQFHNKYLIDSARIAGQETLLEIIPNCSFLGFGDAELVVGESIPDKFHILSAVNYITTTPDVGNVLVDGLKMRGLTANTTNMGVYSSNIAIHTFGLNNVVIQRCTFDDLDLSQVIVSGVRYAGVDYGSKVTVQNNKILSVVAENSVNMDHSSIYIEAPNSFVINNLFSSKTMQCKKVACAVEVHAPNVLTKSNQIYGYSRAGWLAAAPINVHNSNFIDNIAHVSNHLIIVTTTDTARVSKCRISGNTVRCEHATSEANFVTYQGLLVTSGEFDLSVAEIVVDNNLLNIDYSVNPVFATIANLDQKLSALFHDNTIFGAVAGLNALTLDSGGFTKNKVYNHITSAALNKDFFINIGGTSLNSADLSSNEFKFNAATKPSYLISLINMTGGALVNTAIAGNKYLSTQKPQADVYFQPTLNIGGNGNTLDINVFNATVNVPALTAGQERAWTQSLTNNFNNCIVDFDLLPEASFYPLITKGVASGSNLGMRVKAISTAAAFSISGVNMRVRTR